MKAHDRRAHANLPPANTSAMLPSAARAWVAAHYDPSGIVVEFGAGHGTALLRDALPPRALLSIEHSRMFAQFADVYAPLVDGWYDRGVVAAMLAGKKISMVVLDGPPGRIGRHGILDNMHLFTTTAAWLIDDAHRPAEQEIAKNIAGWCGRPLELHPLDGRAYYTITGAP